MATATALERYVNHMFIFSGRWKRQHKNCTTCNKNFTRSGIYEHNKSKNQLLKTGEISKCEKCLD